MTIDWASRGIDVDTPSTARIYDYVLGGKDNFLADREAGDKLVAAVPESGQIARANRVFLQRAVRVCAEAGITQFVDVGTGIPTYPAVHDVAHAVAPEARVVYVDHDPVAAAHARALLTEGGSSDRVTVVEADMRHPHTIIDHPRLRQAIDWDQPVAVLMLLMLHFATDADDPEAIVAAFRDRMAPGSHMVINHVSDDEVPRDHVERFEGVYRAATSTLTFRPGSRIRGLLNGFTLADPGWVYLEQWRPDMPPPMPDGLPEHRWIYAALGTIDSRGQ